MRTLIVGGGLCGLALAEKLQAIGHDYILLEARNRFGGRIKTEQIDGGHYDLGPAWFWPGQTRIAEVIDRFELKTFVQYSDGLMTFETEHGQLHRGRGDPSMQTSWRLQGGIQTLTQRLAGQLPDASKRLDAKVVALRKTSSGVEACLQNGERIIANQIVFALPPRIAAEVKFSPSLDAAATNSLQGVATWMAGQAKAVAIYEKPFWRDAGLSGSVISRLGPLAEIHDASTAGGDHFALFGFIGVPLGLRSDEALLRQQIQRQLGRIFGEAATCPKKLVVKDWAVDPQTATRADQEPLIYHPAYGMPQALEGLWDDQLLFAGSELAPQFGGYLEGALEAAANVINTLKH